MVVLVDLVVIVGVGIGEVDYFLGSYFFVVVIGGVVEIVFVYVL